MTGKVSIVGFGEAARIFASDSGMLGGARVFDKKVANFDTDPAKRTKHGEMFALCDQYDLNLKPTNQEATGGADNILCLVTADQSLLAARESSHWIAVDALYCDMNSVAPQTKQAAATVIERAGGRYVDVAIMAPIKGCDVPLLLSGTHARDAATMFEGLGFTNVKTLSGEVGQASSVKMLRSVMIKGIEALTVEMMLGATRAQVIDEVLASLGDGWCDKAIYNLSRMKQHGSRRAAEMREVAASLRALGVPPLMVENAAQWHADIGGQKSDIMSDVDAIIDRIAGDSPAASE